MVRDMPQKNFSPDPELREKQVLRYVRALDDSNADDLALILEAAESDPELDRLIGEVHEAIHDEAALAPVAADARLVRRLLRQHIPNGFAEVADAGVITVGEIAARLVADRRVPDEDRAENHTLLESGVVLPAYLSRAALNELATGVAPSLSERYWRRFRETAVTVAMGRAHRQVQLAAARQARRRTNPAPWVVRAPENRSGFHANDITSVVRQVYAESGRDWARVTSIAPLDDLIANYPIRVVEESGLTYRSALGILAAELGRAVELPAGGDQRLAGFLYCVLWNGTLYGLILVDRSDPIVRRRFSKAHELGHYVLHFLPLMEHAQPADATVMWEGLVYPDDESGLPSGHRSGLADLQSQATAAGMMLDDEAEREANRFAAELLMPEATCRKAVERPYSHIPSTALVGRLASDAMVSKQAARLRLTELGLLDA
jgi:hypothetical protein